MKHFSLVLSLLFFTSPSIAAPQDETFRYRLFTSDIFPWADGTMKGRVNDQQRHVSSALQEILASSKSEISFSIYGVSKQSWFFTLLDQIKDTKRKAQAVVDQKKGRGGEWDSENFTYRDTAFLPEHMGHRHVISNMGLEKSRASGSIMHNKFMIVDRSKVWMGSANISNTCLGAEYNANASILVESEAVAKMYNSEFEQMFRRQKFSIRKDQLTSNDPIVFGDGTEVAVFFSPQANTIHKAIVPFVEQTKFTLDIAMFYLTHPDVAEAIRRAANRGVRVRLLYDALAASHSSSMHLWLQERGVDVRVENWGGKMHMKSAISDGQHIIIGSMNWSRAGDSKNDENTMVIRNNPKLGKEMQQYFERLWTTLNPSSSSLQTESAHPRAESLDSINSCFDGIDNDHDGYVDSEDFGCSPQES
jgi:phosphatidylserine/phosphatidylglycerophosphate/cardiolipin synthase-like enzyme